MLFAAIQASAHRTARTRRPDTTHSSTASCSASACVDECVIHGSQPCLLVCARASLAVSCTLVIAAGVPASTLSLRLQLPRMIVCKRACDSSSYVPSNSSKSPLVRFYYPTSSCPDLTLSSRLACRLAGQKNSHLKKIEVVGCKRKA